MSQPPLPLDAATPLRLEAAALPRGVTVLEASAGTGKTYAIAALVTRAVAEGVCDLPHILVVTFTRAATAELRDRIRRRLVAAADHLAAAAATVAAGGEVAPVDDDVLDHLAVGGDLARLTVRRDRLIAATRDFDAATISTIHGFTQQVLRSVGLSVDLPRDIELLEDPSTLIDELVDDVTVRRFHDHDPTDPSRPAPPKRAALHALASAVITRPEARLVPTADDADPEAAQIGRLGAELRAEAIARKARRGVLGYDDLLLALRDALADPVRGAQAAAVLRDRYRWALVDEFQDTDPIQWDILVRAFAGVDDDPARALVLIGDPKQAIYAFRGADVATYLRATEAAGTLHSLDRNWRSDAALLAALEPLLEGTHFGDDRITFRRVRAADEHAGSALRGAGDLAPLQLRVVGDTPGGSAAPAVRRHLADDVAATVVTQLRDVRLGRDQRPLRPRRIAVLVRTNAEAGQVQRALQAVDVPSVVNGVGSVLLTQAGTDWRWLLDALERPSDPARARRFAVSAWGGWDAATLAAADSDDGEREGRPAPGTFDHLHDQLHRWAAVLRDHGVATLERVVTRETGVAERLLACVGGERRLTDLRHVGQLLHVAEQHDERGVTGLRAWLQARRAEADDGDLATDEEARRLESDDEAVQILTIHRSKGLEYDVVLVPYLWGGGQSPGVPLIVDDLEGDGRLIDAGPRGRGGFAANAEQATRENIGEALRLAYVAVTRAKHRAIVWWARVNGSERSSLARLLFRDDGAVSLAEKVVLPDQERVAEVLRGRFAGAGASVAEVAPRIDPDPWTDDTPIGAGGLTARGFDRTLDRTWRRTSYSAIVRLAEHRSDGDVDLRVASEAAVALRDDEPEEPDLSPADAGPADADEAALRAQPVPLGDVRGGAAFGTLLHAVLEHADFTVDDLDAEVARHLDDQVRRHGLAVDHDRIADGLVAAITSPLGPLAGRVAADGGSRWRRLADVARADRLDELTFELPLAGGDRGHRDGAAVALAGLADLLDDGLPRDDPFRGAGLVDRLRSGGFRQDLRGYLTGAIDLVVRVPDDAGGHRFLVADHKSNRVAWPDVPTAWDHRPEALAHAMVAHDYPLQALLYQVALHRFLAWRLPGYDPQRHLGGALYLFLRGMTGPDTPEVGGAPCGVAAWRPPSSLVVAVSALLSGGGDA